MLQNCLLVLPQSWCHQIFETDRRNVKRRTECLSEVFFYTSAKKKVVEPADCKSLPRLQRTTLVLPRSLFLADEDERVNAI